MVHPKALTDDAFCEHMHDLYKQQLSVPEFKALIGKLPIYAIWDDHDFLWNDADARDSYHSNVNFGKSYFSSQLLKCWRKALITKDNIFPLLYTDSFIKGKYENLPNENYDEYMPGYNFVKFDASTIKNISTEIILHLTDGRSWRYRNSMLGTKQKEQIEATMRNNTNAIHLIASGSTFGGKSVQGWDGYSVDHDWLLKLANKYRILVLSGDVHSNVLPMPLVTDDKNPLKCNKLFEATSSGAAIDFIRVHNNGTSSTKNLFNYSEHFGILDIQKNGNVKVSFFDHGDSTLTQSRVINSSFTNFV
jgi:alkaline phosphatase D